MTQVSQIPVTARIPAGSYWPLPTKSLLRFCYGTLEVPDKLTVGCSMAQFPKFKVGVLFNYLWL